MLESVSATLFDHTTRDASLHPKTPGSSGADLSLVRHLHLRLTRNLFTMSRLPLCLRKAGISGLVRHPCAGTPHSLSYIPQPSDPLQRTRPSNGR
jgi:hypothetical protein